jgi:hypothetical protein
MTDTMPETRPVDDWAAELFPTSTSATGRVSLHAGRWRHEVAAVLHGWREHAHHAGAPLELTRDDYDLAILAVDDGAPHLAALSPFKGCAV